MAMADSKDQYFVYENRLNSFKVHHAATKKRASNAASRAPKTLQWPHKSLAPADLARVGFVFDPLPDNPDNVVCFLCDKALDGWEENDNPLEEHLKHSPSCGWAITAAIEAEEGDYGKLHPLEPGMLDARKATFAGKWPYESKKGFKCKTKQLVEAGWKYTPTLESDDMATCTYCQLALDGWESGDKPIDEHYKRSPNCPFFALISQNPPPAKKGGRTKPARGSKASRLSIQSVATAVSDIPADVTSHPDDSIMTTTSIMSKKSTRGKKGAAPKGRKTRTKKDEAVEIHEDEPEMIDVPPAPPKPARGRKRVSDEMEDTATTNAEAPVTKKRAVGTKSSAAIETSPAPDDVEMPDAAPPANPAGKKNARSRKASQASIRSQASTASLRAKMTDDEELEHQLQADLDAPLTDDEHLMVDSDSERMKPQARGRPKKGTTTRKASAQKQKAQVEEYAMFDPSPPEHDEAAIEAEMKALESEVAEERAQPMENLEVPKKGRKAGTRKASKQTKKTKEPAPLSDAVPEPEPEPEAKHQVVEEATDKLEPVDDPDVSTGTVINKAAPRESIGKRGRGRPPKKSISSQPRQSHGASEVSLMAGPDAVSTQLVVEIKSATARESLSAMKTAPGKVASAQEKVTPAAPTPVAATPSPEPKHPTKALPALPHAHARQPQPPATPRAHAKPSASAKQATLSPSQSPQSSDAENQPPSSKAGTNEPPKRVILAPVAATPVRTSPSKRNVIAGLRSTTPWTAVDLDAMFSPGGGKENGIDRLLREGCELTSPEKRMTVEEWVFHNASQAEQKLKNECEAMVSSFESQGTKAMAVLEGLVTE